MIFNEQGITDLGSDSQKKDDRNKIDVFYSLYLFICDHFKSLFAQKYHSH